MKRCLLGVRTDIFFIVSFAFLADSIKEYVRLIEGQMNNDELFCYFINQLDYYENHPNEDKGKPPVIHVFSATPSISIFVPKNEIYDDTRRSCRNYYVLQGTQSNL